MTKSHLLALAAVACLAVPATAGHKSPGYGVNVNLAGRSASGALGTTHNSSSTVESIYCTVGGFETWTAVSCAAVNSSNVFAACNITNPPQPMLDALASLGPDSHISFTWSAQYKCTNITVWTGSSSFAKVPPPASTVVGGIF